MATPMRPVLQHIYEAALEPHLTGDQFRLAVVKAVQQRNVEAHETFDEAFKRFIQEAIFEFERENLAKYLRLFDPVAIGERSSL